LKRILWTAALLVAGTLVAGDAPPTLPTVDQLLDAVVAQLPRDPLRITGDLSVRRRHGVVERELKFDMELRWGEQPPRACYTIRDAFGSDLESLTVLRPPREAPRFEYARGNPLRPAPLPDLSSSIQGSDITWTDLSLSFLWWRDGEVTGTDEVSGRECYVVVVKVPPESAKGEAGRAYARARMWVDQKASMVLQAEALNAQGEVVRRLWVRSLKKITEKVREQWMIKDLEVQQFPSVHRTKLTVHDVDANEN
jgi:hypothetical protein